MSDGFNPEDYLSGEEKVILWDAMHTLKHSNNDYEIRDLLQVIRSLNDLAVTKYEDSLRESERSRATTEETLKNG